MGLIVAAFILFLANGVASNPMMRPQSVERASYQCPAPSSSFPNSRPQPSYHEPTLKLSLKVDGINLRNTDYLSKSDPQLTLYQVNKFREELQPNEKQIRTEIHRSEVIRNNLDPKFKEFKVEYRFEAVQKLVFSLKDIDRNGPPNFLGEIECNMARLASFKTIKQDLKDPNKPKQKYGQLEITAVPVTTTEKLRIQIQAQALDRKKRNIYLVIYRTHGTEKKQVFSTADSAQGFGNSKMVFETNRNMLVGSGEGDALLDRKFLIECYEKHGKFNVFKPRSELIGSARIPLRNLLDQQIPEIKLYKSTDKGLLNLVNLHVTVQKFDFMEYVRNQALAFAVAIDFTLSNGKPSLQTSLHYTGNWNEYQKAIWEVAQVLEQYAKTKDYGTYGFGAIVPQDFRLDTGYAWEVSDLFTLGGKKVVDGLSSLLEAYKDTINNVEFSGPTKFAKVIGEATSRAASMSKIYPPRYLVQLILTDGDIHDVEETVDAIVEASKQPLSIVIIGVGTCAPSSSTGNMALLDNDNNQMWIQYKKKPKRDIVQYVPFYEVIKKNKNIAAEVMYEIPKQLESYLALNGRNN